MHTYILQLLYMHKYTLAQRYKCIYMYIPSCSANDSEVTRCTMTINGLS